MIKDCKAFLALHRYFIWANRLRDCFLHAVDRRKHEGEIEWADELGLFMSHWYGSLYVVVEGYRELAMSDPMVDELLRSNNVDLLKRFRNGTFHFQKKYFDQRFTDFWMDSQDTVYWVHGLHKALGIFFLKTIREHKEENS